MLGEAVDEPSLPLLTLDSKVSLEVEVGDKEARDEGVLEGVEEDPREGVPPRSGDDPEGVGVAPTGVPVAAASTPVGDRSVVKLKVNECCGEWEGVEVAKGVWVITGEEEGVVRVDCVYVEEGVKVGVGRGESVPVVEVEEEVEGEVEGEPEFCGDGDSVESPRGVRVPMEGEGRKGVEVAFPTPGDFVSTGVAVKLKGDAVAIFNEPVERGVGVVVGVEKGWEGEVVAVALNVRRGVAVGEGERVVEGDNVELPLPLLPVHGEGEEPSKGDGLARLLPVGIKDAPGVTDVKGGVGVMGLVGEGLMVVDTVEHCEAGGVGDEKVSPVVEAVRVEAPRVEGVGGALWQREKVGVGVMVRDSRGERDGVRRPTEGEAVPLGDREEEREVRGEWEGLCIADMVEDTLGEEVLKGENEEEVVEEWVVEPLEEAHDDTDVLPLPLSAEESEREGVGVAPLDWVGKRGVEEGQGDAGVLGVGTLTVWDTEGEEDREVDRVASSGDTLPLKAGDTDPDVEEDTTEEVVEDREGEGLSVVLGVLANCAREGLPLPAGVADSVGETLPPPPFTPMAVVGVAKSAATVKVAGKREGEEGLLLDALPLPE
jgi:hypothetical protein